MKRLFVTCAVALVAIAAAPSRAAADVTFFLGLSPTPDVRSARGFAVGVNLLIVGFEFDYANVKEDTTKAAAPGLKAGMFNVLVMTPTSGRRSSGRGGHSRSTTSCGGPTRCSTRSSTCTATSRP